MITRRHMLQCSLLTTASSLLHGCGGSSGDTASKGSNSLQPVPTGPLSLGTVIVAATVVGSIGKAFAGLSYEKSVLYEPLFTETNAELIGLFARLGPSVLRIGGNSVDKNVWTPEGVGRTSGQIAPSDVTALAAFLKASGWQCLYGINLGGSATGSTTPQLAAEEVAYVSNALGASLLGVEIGNECDLYGNTGSYYAGSWSLAQFETLWRQYVATILASTPTVSITGPASASNEATWTVPFGQAVTSAEISLLTQHYYRANGSLATSTAAYLITPDPALTKDLGTLQVSATTTGIPFRIAECNSYYNGGASGISDSYASALWVIDFLFNCSEGGAAGVNFHGGGNSAGYTPIADKAGVVVEARPEYYGILLFALAGTGSLYETQVGAASLNVTAYTVKSASGGLNLIIVNKELVQNLQLTVTLPAAEGSGVTQASVLEMTQQTAGVMGPTLAATSGVTIQGAGVNTDGSFNPAAAYTVAVNRGELTCYAPALTAILLQLT